MNNDELKRHIIEVLESVEVAAKRNVLESTMERVKEVSAERIIQLVENELHGINQDA